MIEFV